MKGLAYFPWYYQRFEAATRTWTDQEVGAYVRLLNHQWDQGYVPADARRRNRIATSLKRTWNSIKDKFPPDPHDSTRLLNPVLEEIRAKVDEKSAKAKKAAETRWSGRNADASADKGAESMPPNPKPKKKKTVPKKEPPAEPATLTPQQQRVESVLEILPMKPGRAALLLKQWEPKGDEACLEALRTAVDHFPLQPPNYILQVMGTTLKESAGENGGDRGPLRDNPSTYEIDSEGKVWEVDVWGASTEVTDKIEAKTIKAKIQGFA